jgi:preprotein translocase subunit SecG
MISTLLVIQIVLAIAIIIAVLLQKSSSMGLGAYSGSNESMFGAKGPASFLAKSTFALALLFVVNTLAMGYLYNQDKNQSIADTISSSTTSVPKSVAPKATETKQSTQTAVPKAVETNSTK